MSFVTELLKRADLREVTEFLMVGAEKKEKEIRSCEERIRGAERTLCEWIEAGYPSFEEQNRATDTVFGAVGQVSEAYLELGLVSGIRLAAQYYEEIQPNGQKGKVKCRAVEKKC